MDHVILRRLAGLTLVTLTSAVLVSESPAEARAWKSKFGSRSIKGEFVELRDGKVTLINEGGDKLSIPLSALAADDQTIAKEAQAKLDAATRIDVLSALDGKMTKLSDGKMVPFSFAKDQQPHHILFYVISSTCPSCNDHAPLLKEYAKDSLAGSGIEVVVISIDEEKEDQEEFLAVQKLTFGAIAHESKKAFEKAIGPNVFQSGVDGCQTYILANVHGKVITKSALIPKIQIAKVATKAPSDQ